MSSYGTYDMVGNLHEWVDDPDGTFRFLSYYPPLFPLSVSALGVFGADLAQAARWLNALLFALLVWLGLNTLSRERLPLLRNGRNVMMNWTSTLSPTMTFDLRFGVNRWEEAGGSSIGADYDPKQLGIDSALVAQFNRYQFPRFDIEGYWSVGSDAFGPGTRDYYAGEEITLADNFTQVIGVHNLKVGYEMIRARYNQAAGVYPSGSYSFGGTGFPFKPNTGNNFAAFLLGSVSSASESAGTSCFDQSRFAPTSRSWSWSLPRFPSVVPAQDDGAPPSTPLIPCRVLHCPISGRRFPYT